MCGERTFSLEVCEPSDYENADTLNKIVDKIYATDVDSPAVDNIEYPVFNIKPTLNEQVGTYDYCQVVKFADYKSWAPQKFLTSIEIQGKKALETS